MNDYTKSLAASERSEMLDEPSFDFSADGINIENTLAIEQMENEILSRSLKNKAIDNNFIRRASSKLSSTAQPLTNDTVDNSVKAFHSSEFSDSSSLDEEAVFHLDVKAELLTRDRIISNYLNGSTKVEIPKLLKEDLIETKMKEIVEFQFKSDQIYSEKELNTLSKTTYLYFTVKTAISDFFEQIVSSKTFDYTSLLLIILNSLVILVFDLNSENEFLVQLENIFLYLFTIEMVAKILAYGLILPRNSYLREIWNILDFIVVTTGWVSVSLESNSERPQGLSALRAFRILRPLRSVKSIPELRFIIFTLVESLSSIGDILIILLFFFLIFAICGVQIWAGSLKKRCFSLDLAYFTDRFCSDASDCFENQICLKGDSNPMGGAFHFDNVLNALLTVFTIVTLEGWSQIYRYVVLTFRDEYQISRIIADLFFFFLVFIGGFYLINLYLAVIKSKFSEIRDTKREKIGFKSRNLAKLILAKLDEKSSKFDDEFDFEELEKRHIKMEKNVQAIPVNLRSVKDIFFLKSLESKDIKNLKKQIKNEKQEAKKEYKSEVKLLKLLKSKRKAKILFEEAVKKVDKSVINFDFIKNYKLKKEVLILASRLTFNYFRQIARIAMREAKRSNNRFDSREFDSRESVLDSRENILDSRESVVELDSLINEQNKRTSNRETYSSVRSNLSGIKGINSQIYLSKPKSYILDSIETETKENSKKIRDSLKRIQFVPNNSRNVDFGEEDKSGRSMLIEKDTFKIEEKEDSIEMSELFDDFGELPKTSPKEHQRRRISRKFHTLVNRVTTRKQIKLKKKALYDESTLKSDTKLRRSNSVTKNVCKYYQKHPSKLTEAEEEVHTSYRKYLNHANNLLGVDFKIGSFKETEQETAISTAKFKKINESELSALSLFNPERVKLPLDVQIDCSIKESTLEKDHKLTNLPSSLFKKTLYSPLEIPFLPLAEIDEEDYFKASLAFDNDEAEEEKMPERVENKLLHEEILTYDTETGTRMLKDNSGVDIFGEKHIHLVEYPVIWPLSCVRYYHYTRYLFYKLTNSYWFDMFILFVILVNAVVMALEGDILSERNVKIVDYVHLVCNCLFVLEFLLKVVGQGPVMYFADLMNYIDFTVVVISIVEICIGNLFASESVDLTSVGILRVIRVFRIAKILRKMKTTQRILSAIALSVNNVIYLVVLLLIFTVIYIVLGKSTLSTFEEFKDSLNSFYSVIQILTVENWNELLIKFYANKFSLVFLISWIFLGNYVLFNLFLSILIESFGTEIPLPEDKTPLYFRQSKPKESSTFTISTYTEYSLGLFWIKSSFRKKVRSFVFNPNFDSFILFLIFLNTLRLVFSTFSMFSYYTKAFEFMDLCFYFLFTLEMILKVIAMGLSGPSSYLDDHWNKLDCLIVFISLADVQSIINNYSNGTHSKNFEFFKILRLLRTLRPLRFISHNVQMRLIVTSFLDSLNAILNVSVLVLLVIFMFSITGISLFSTHSKACFVKGSEPLVEVKDFYKIMESYYITDYFTDEAAFICTKYGGFTGDTKPFSFSNIGNAFVTCFTLGILEGWPDIMKTYVFT